MSSPVERPSGKGDGRDGLLTRLVVCTYRSLAAALPARLRRLKRDEMTALFRELWLEERWRRGTLAALVLALRLGAGLVGAAGREWRSSPRSRVSGDDPNGSFTQGWLHDIRFGLRAVWHRPGFALAVIVTLAVAIGVNSTIFSMVRYFVFVPIPYESPERLAILRGRNLELNRLRSPLSMADVVDLGDGLEGLGQLASYRTRRIGLTGVAQPARINAMQVDANYFSVTGVGAFTGRTFSAQEAAAGGEPVVLIGHGAWQRRFGGDPTILQRTLRLGGVEHQVIGVVDPEMEFGSLREIELWLPLPPDVGSARDRRDLTVIARLAAGNSVERIQAEASAIAHQLADRYPETNRGWDVEVIGLRDALMGTNARRVLAIMSVAVAFVLAIACVNVANLMLARAAGRRRELAVRRALGARRARLIRQLLTESLVLATAAGLLGLVVTRLLFAALVGVTRSRLPFFTELTIDPTVFAFAMGLAVLTPAVFALLPAIRGTAEPLHSGLKDGASRTVAAGQGRASRWLVGAQVGLAVLLLVVSTIAVRSVVALTRMELGFDADQTLTLVLEPTGTDSPITEESVLRGLDSRLGDLVDVVGVGATSHLPIVGGEMTRGLEIEGGDSTGAEQLPRVALVYADAGFFDVTRIPLLGGEIYASNPEAQRPALVSQRAAELFWATRNPVGDRIRVGAETWHEIVGVVGDVRNPDADQPPEPHVYLPLTAAPIDRIAVVARTRGDPSNVREQVRSEIALLLPDVPAEHVRSMQEVLYDDLASDYAIIGLLALFAATAFALALAGTYGVVAYAVTGRVPEIGVRMALGARAVEIQRLVLRDGLRPVVAGALFGLATGFAVARLMAGMFFGVSPTDPATFIGVPVALLGASTLACLIPARRAARVDPVDSLRGD